MDAEKIVKDLYQIFIEQNNLNDMGDAYFPEQEFIEYFKRGE